MFQLTLKYLKLRKIVEILLSKVESTEELANFGDYHTLIWRPRYRRGELTALCYLDFLKVLRFSFLALFLPQKT